MKRIKVKPDIIRYIKYAPNSAYDLLAIEFMYQNNDMEKLGFNYREIREMVQDLKLSGAHGVYEILMALNMKDLFDYMIDTLETPINGDMLLTMHNILADKTREDRQGFKGCWKKLPNRIIGFDVAFVRPEDVEMELQKLLNHWNSSNKTLDDIIEFHTQFEYIHPFSSGNGIIGRLIMLKQCIENDLDLIIIDSEHSADYFEGLYLAQKFKDETKLKKIIQKCSQEMDNKLSTLAYTIDSTDWDRVFQDDVQMKGY